jgi:hypothetical protein
MKKAMIAAILAIALASSAACSPRMFNAVATAAIIGVAIAGTAHLLAHHDHHYHHHHCGHEYRYHDGHYVYYYQDRWEYYDPETRRWYVYR